MVFLFAILAAAFWAGQVSAEPIVADLQSVSRSPGLFASASYTIEQINAAGGIVVGDKLFDSFTVTATALGGALAPDAGSISVAGIQSDGDYGLKFNGGWSASGGQQVDSSIVFHVSVLPDYVAQGFAIDGNSVKLTLYGNSAANGQVSVSENLYTQNPSLPGASFVDEITWYKSGANQKTVDTASFARLTGFWVGKDVIASGGVDTGAFGLAHLSEFHQTFHQTQTPEPSTLALLAVGALGLVGYGWRRRS